MRFLLISIVSLLFATSVFGWENKKTHPDLSEYAAKKYFGTNSTYLDQKVNGNEVRFWIRYGAEHEDDGFSLQFWTPAVLPPRYLNHFHAPTRPLDSAGLDDTIINTVLGGVSAVVWAQDPQDQKTSSGGNWSWQAVRDYYYNSLTACVDGERQTSLANTLTGLGYQMHLLQDMSQPDHVRNSTHMVDGSGYFWGLETWAKDNDGIINSFAQGPLPDVTVDLTKSFTGTTIKPVVLGPVARLFDTRSYYNGATPSTLANPGLSEYTNANFFSQSTIFAAERFSPGDDYYFPYPKKSSTDLQSYLDRTKLSQQDTVAGNVVDKANYIAKTGDGEQLTYLAQQGVSTRFIQAVLGEGESLYWSFKLDDACYYDYASKLVPMAVGYSKAMLDYFFRGKLTVTTPTVTYSGITLDLENSTPNEAAATGTVALIVRYKTPSESSNGAVSQLGDPVGDYTYKVVEKSDINLSNKIQNLTFTFTDGSLPSLYSEMSFQLAYKGALGNEPDSVAVSPWIPVHGEIGAGYTGAGSGTTSNNGGSGGSTGTGGTTSVAGITSDLVISVPDSGIYAKTEYNTFTELGIKVTNNLPGGVSGGTFELAVAYRTAISDPFQSQMVATTPTSAYTNVARYPLKTGATSLTPGIPAQLLFDLSNAPIAITSTDVKIYLTYKSNTGKPLAVGYRDISEPTPVDVFNNTDYTCAGGQWYQSGSPALLQLNYNPTTYLRDVRDLYPHDIANITFWVNTPDNTVLTSSASLAPNNLRRLGYILSDAGFSYGFNEDYVHTSTYDTWVDEQDTTLPLTGTAVANFGSTYPGMYTMRGKPMWWGAGVVYDNDAYRAGWAGAVDTSCDWAALPK